MKFSNPYEKVLNDYKNSLVVDYMPAVRAMAARLKERLPSSVDFNDLVSIGYEELVKISKRYDVKKNDNFWGYAKTRIYGAMLDFLRNIDIVSRNNRQLIKKIETAVDNYIVKYGYEPSDEELSSILSIDKEKIKSAKNAGEIYSVMPIEEQMYYFYDIDKKIEEEELIEEIMKILATLKEKEKLVIQLYYFEELSFKEISEILDISESRISQIHKKVISILRKRLNG